METQLSFAHFYISQYVVNEMRLTKAMRHSLIPLPSLFQLLSQM